MRDEAELERLAEGVRALDRRGSSDEEIAVWLKDRTATFGESGKVLALARELTTTDAYAVLEATETWRAAATRFHIITPGGEVSGEFVSVNGRTFSVGDVLKLPRGSCRVVAVDPDDDPRFTGRLIVEPIKRLEPRE